MSGDKQFVSFTKDTRVIISYIIRITSTISAAVFNETTEDGPNIYSQPVAAVTHLYGYLAPVLGGAGLVGVVSYGGIFMLMCMFCCGTLLLF